MIDTIGMTDIGNGRPSNQDAYLLRQKEKNGKLYLLAVVCDGMGGLKKGEIASHYIVEVLKQWFDETLFDGLETMGIDMIEQNLIEKLRGDIEILKQEIDGGDDEAAEEDIEDIEE